MPAPSADRNLLFGILALQMDFITRDQLVAAMNAWVLDKHLPLGQILVQQQALPQSKRDLLEPLVEQHIQDHAGDPQKSLAALSSASSIAEQLRAVPDTDVQQSLAHVSAADPFKTRTQPPLPPDDGPGQRYRILRHHASGGLGDVFVARDAELNRQVALKEIKPGKDHPHSRSRFLLEAEITGGLEHPGIVPVYGLGHYADGRPYYAMRFIKGDNLAEAIKRFHATQPVDFNSLDFRRLLQRFIDVCQAVAYAHSRGVLHRDLKPGNIMLGKYGETLVVDWGLAKTQATADHPHLADEPPLTPNTGSGEPTVAGSALGTPLYMSPEQAEGRLDMLGPASDVYSLGATLYHLLTGQAPNAGHDPLELLARCATGDIPPPRSVAAEVPQPLEAVCQRAMALEPNDRYVSAQALADDIENYLADEPIGAFAEPLIARLKRWVRNHPGPMTGLAAALIVGVAGLASGLYFVNAEKARTESARQYADRQHQIAKQNYEASKARSDDMAAILKFVQDHVFAAPRPGKQAGGIGHNVTMADVVRSALPKLDLQFAGKPFVDASLRQSLARTLAYLGEAKDAHAHFKRVVALLTEAKGPDDADTLTSMNDLANSCQALGQYAEALVLHQETLRMQTAKLGSDHPSTLRSMNNLAIDYHALGRHREALALREETLRLQMTKLGPDDPDTLASMGNLANSYLALGRHNEALALYEQTLKHQKAKLGPDHADTLGTMSNIAVSLSNLGRHDEALSQREVTLKLRKANLGLEHPDTLRSMYSLADSYAACSRHSEAIALYEESLELQKAKLGADHTDTLWCMNNLAYSYEALDRHQQALTVREELLRLRRNKFGADHPDTLLIMAKIAGNYVALDRIEDAVTFIDDALQRVEGKVHVHPQVVTYLYDRRLRAFLKKGDSAGCQATAEMWDKLNRTDGDSLYNAACFHSVCAAVIRAKKNQNPDEQADRSMACLSKAVAAGYADVEHMRKDKDLDALRDRDDFKKLVADLEAKVAARKAAEAKPGGTKPAAPPAGPRP